MKKVQRWLVLPDLQLPYEDKRTIKAIESYMKDVAKSSHPFDGWLQLGDFLDFNELSRFNAGYEASIKEDVAESFAAGNEFLDRQQKLILSGNRNARFVLLQGNHNYRAVDYALKFPFLKGILDYEKNLRLKERKIKYVKCWENKQNVFSLGKANFIHGNFVCTNHAKKMVDVYGTNIFYGHVHDVMEFPRQMMGKDKTIAGKSLGTLCRYDQKYLKGNPTSWQQSFSEFWILPNGFFNEFGVKIFNHGFTAPSGKFYSG